MIPNDYFNKLVRNAAYCTKCNTEVESKHRHDFVMCKCGEIFVDGGLSYVRYGFVDDKTFINRAEYRQPTIEELKYEIAKANNDLAYGLYSKDHTTAVKQKAQELLKDLYGI